MAHFARRRRQVMAGGAISGFRITAPGMCAATKCEQHDQEGRQLAVENSHGDRFADVQKLARNKPEGLATPSKYYTIPIALPWGGNVEAAKIPFFFKTHMLSFTSLFF